MSFFIWLFVILTTVVGVLLIRKYTTLEFVEHARLLFKTWSVWLTSLGSAISAWVQSFPDAALNAWNILPPDIKSFLPQQYLGYIGAFMVAMGVIAQFVRQRKLLERKQQLDSQP